MRPRDQHPNPREFSLLCEGCGYVVEGLNPERPCPECARIVATSLPARRSGSAWQARGGGLWAWVLTALEIIRHPRRTFANLIIERRQSRRLLNVNLCVAGGIGAFGSADVLLSLYRSMRTTPVGPEARLAAPLLGAILLICLLSALTSIERRGVRFFGNQRGWRVTQTVSEAVCAHASFGWIIAAALFSGATLFQEPVMEYLAHISPMTRAVVWAALAVEALPAAGFLAGLLIFESLVYVGVRACRFANRTGANGLAVEAPLSVK